MKINWILSKLSVDVDKQFFKTSSFLGLVCCNYLKNCTIDWWLLEDTTREVSVCVFRFRLKYQRRSREILLSGKRRQSQVTYMPAHASALATNSGRNVLGKSHRNNAALFSKFGIFWEIGEKSHQSKDVVVQRVNTRGHVRYYGTNVLENARYCSHETWFTIKKS